MAAVVILISHQHQLSVAQILCGLVALPVTQAQDLLDVLKLLVILYNLVRCIPHVERFTCRDAVVLCALFNGSLR